MATHDDVRRIAATLPGSIEGEEGFGFSVTNKGKAKGFLWLWNERVDPKKPKQRNPSVLAISTQNVMVRDLLIESNPEVFFTEPHYNGFPAVLVRLDLITLTDLEEVMLEGWRAKAGKEWLSQWPLET